MNYACSLLLLALLLLPVQINYAQSGHKARHPQDSASLEVGASVDAAENNERAVPATDIEVNSAEELTAVSPIVPSNAEVKGSSLWLTKMYHITCCLGGTPTVNNAELIKNFTFHLLNYVIDEQAGDAMETEGGNSASTLNCRVFHGTYLVPPPSVLILEYAIQVQCKCPEVGSNHIVLDRNCRRLPSCKNNGFRSLINPMKCLCIQPFFGNHCEKFCDQGQRLRGLNGRDYCSCSPFYKGPECREMVCLNGGHEENGRCICPSQFLGYHCEIDTNRTGHSTHDFHGNNHGTNSRFQRFGDQNNEMFTRDISGTIFSLIMIVVLVVSMYLLMKHRMQVQTRYLSRRPDLLGACNFPIVPPSSGLSARRVELVPSMEDHSRTFPFRSIITAVVGDGGPPPYIPPGHRGRRARDESLPPLPSYEDATKLPPLRHNGTEAEEEATGTAPDSTNPQDLDRRAPPSEEDESAANAASFYSVVSSSSSSSNGTPVHCSTSQREERHHPHRSIEEHVPPLGENLRRDRQAPDNEHGTQLSTLPAAQSGSQQERSDTPLTTSQHEESSSRHTSV